jgi:bifunctional enzyme CysN/CysC
MDDATRTPLEKLESEAIYLLRESAALFRQPTLLAGHDARSQALAKLARRAFAPDQNPLFNHRPGLAPDALLSAESGDHFEVWPLFGKPPRETEPWRIYPLASWSEQDVRAFLAEQDPPRRQPRMLRVCTVGEAGCGKSTLVHGLADHAEGEGEEGAVHRHLQTEERRFFIIDPPGQEPYSHGLMAAASATEAALLVLDAQRGLTTMARRQAFVLALMGVPHLLVVINKMDAVGYSLARYQNILSDFEKLTALVEIKNLSFLPLSATQGANLVEPDARLGWYQGPTLVEQLESLTAGALRNLTDLRLPVQQVSGQRTPRIAGRLASGRLTPGDPVVVLPSGEETRVRAICRGETSEGSALAGDSITLELEGQVRVEPGDLLASPHSLPTRSSELEAVLLWLGERPPEPGKRYLVHHGARLVTAHLSEVLSRLDPESLIWVEPQRLERGDIARVTLTTAAPLYFDSYTTNREMGAVAVLDADSHSAVGTGILRGPAQVISDVSEGADRLKSANVVKDPTLVEPVQRTRRYGHKAAVLWFTGLSGSGKSAVAKQVEKRLFEMGCHTLFLDGDNVRSGLNGDLGFTEEARTESTRRMAELARLVFEQGQIVVCSFISGKAADREFVRSLIPEGRYFECYVNCPLEVCRARDPKKLYEKADAGKLLSFSGISLPYEEPPQPEIELLSDQDPPEVLAEQVISRIRREGII